MIIGNFKYKPDQDSYLGDLRTLTFSRSNVRLVPLRKISDREPDYRVVEETESGMVEFGAAWKRHSDKGTSFLSVVLDDPSLGHALNVAMFEDRDGAATLVWTRPRAKTNDAEPEAAAPKARRVLPTRAARLG